MLWAFSPGYRDQSVEVSAEINGSFKFSILGLYKCGLNPAPDYLMKSGVFV